MISANLFARAVAAFVVGGLAVLVVHQPVVALQHALGSTPITAYSLRATRPWGIPVFLSLSFWGGIWAIPIIWVLDRLPGGWIYWIGAICFGALPPTFMTWFVIFPLKGLSPSNAGASVGAVNALIVNGVWGFAIGFAWSRLLAAAPAALSRSLLPTEFEAETDIDRRIYDHCVECASARSFRRSGLCSRRCPLTSS